MWLIERLLRLPVQVYQDFRDWRDRRALAKKIKKLKESDSNIYPLF